MTTLDAAPAAALCTPGDIPGQLAAVHAVYRRWLGPGYDLGALDCALCAAAAERLGGDPVWLLVVGGSGAAKTETIMPLEGAGALTVSTISGEAALLSGTSKKDQTKTATGGLLRSLGSRGLLVIKDVTSILSMNRDTRAAVLAALREVYDGHWTRNVGTDGGQTLTWKGRIGVVGAVTTSWDAAHSVIAAMGDRFVLVRVDSKEGRREASRQAMRNVDHEVTMRRELREAVGDLLDNVDPTAGGGPLTDEEMERLFQVADLVTRARSAVERDFSGEPLFAHAIEMPTRFAKQLAQLFRGAVALGMDRPAALAVALRAAGDSMPPLRLRVLLDVADHPGTTTADVVKREQLPRKTVDRTLQELHLLDLLEVGEVPWGQSVRWAYSLSKAGPTGDDHAGALAAIRAEKLTRNVTRCVESAAPPADPEAGR